MFTPSSWKFKIQSTTETFMMMKMNRQWSLLGKRGLVNRKLVQPMHPYSANHFYTTNHINLQQQKNQPTPTSASSGEQVRDLNSLMTQYYVTALEMQQQEERRRQEREQKEKQDDANNNNKNKPSNWYSRWKGLFFGSSTVTAVGLYFIWQQSFQPIADMRKTFSGIRYFTTDPAYVVRPDVEKQRLKEELNKLDNKQILIICAPERAGKSTLLESVLSDSLRYEVCQVKLKGASGGDYLMQRLRISFGLEESAIEAAIRKVLAVGDFGKKTDVKQKNEFIDIASEVESRLNINILNILNRHRVIVVDGVSHLVYSLDPSGNNGTTNTTNTDFIAVKELFNWLSQLENCSVVLVSTDGFIDKVVQETGLTKNVKYVTMNDMTYEQSKKAYQELLSLYGNKSEIPFDQLYHLVGGRTYHLDKIARNPTQDTIDELRIATKQSIKNIARGEVGRSVDRTPPLTRKYVLNRLIAKCDENDDKLRAVPPNAEAKLLEKFTSIGEGNGQGGCGVGIEMQDLLDAGVSRTDIEKLSRSRIISYNPVDSRVTLPCRLHFNLLKEYRSDWENECNVTVRIKNQASDKEESITLSSNSMKELQNTVRKVFNISPRSNIELYMGSILLNSEKQLLKLMPGQSDISFKVV